MIYLAACIIVGIGLGALFGGLVDVFRDDEDEARRKLTVRMEAAKKKHAEGRCWFCNLAGAKK